MFDLLEILVELRRRKVSMIAYTSQYFDCYLKGVEIRGVAEIWQKPGYDKNCGRREQVLSIEVSVHRQRAIDPFFDDESMRMPCSMDTGFTQGNDRPGEVFTIFSMTSLMEKSVKNNRACSQDDTLQVLIDLELPVTLLIFTQITTASSTTSGTWLFAGSSNFVSMTSIATGMQRLEQSRRDGSKQMEGDACEARDRLFLLPLGLIFMNRHCL
jgi:hypothetical protein